MEKILKEKKIKKLTLLEVYYLSLSPTNAKKFLENVCKLCNVEISTFYRRLKAPNAFNPAEQQAIATMEELPVNDLFPTL